MCDSSGLPLDERAVGTKDCSKGELRYPSHACYAVQALEALQLLCQRLRAGVMRIVQEVCMVVILDCLCV